MIPGRQAGARPYYGWALVAALSVSVTAAYGILSYAFPVFLAPMEAELGWSRTALTGAYSLAALVAGLAAVPAGRWVDRRGARGLMTAGAILAALLLVAWARVDRLAVFYLIWLGLGIAQAGVLYEPAFTVVANWFVRLRSRALTVLTFVGGFASVIFVPLATELVATQGWRTALLVLAGILAVCSVPAHALLLRHRPQDLGLEPDGGPEPAIERSSASTPAGVVERSTPARQAVRSASFRNLALGFGLATIVTTAFGVHLIPYLMERGHDAAFAGAAMAAVGTVALPGRLVFTPLGARWSRAWVTASIFLLQVVGALVLLSTDRAVGVWVFVALFGIGFGAITPARAAFLAELYGPASFGSINGVLSLVLCLARAAAPVGASLLYSATAGYDAVLWSLAACSLFAAVAVVRAGAAQPDRRLQLAEVSV